MKFEAKSDLTNPPSNGQALAQNVTVRLSLKVAHSSSVTGWLVELGFKVALHDVDDQRLSGELLYSTYIAYRLFTSGPNDRLQSI